MKSKKILLAGAAVAAALASVPAMAGPILFQLVGNKTATFMIDSSTTPDYLSTSIFGDQVSYNGVDGTFGASESVATIGFGTSIFAQLNIGGTTLGFTQYGGPDLFSLVNGMPVFNFGTFTLQSITSGPATITISAVAAAVPEPASWGLMVLGFGMLGGAIRYRRGKTAVAFA